jgi:hypothetical protein
MNMTWDEYISAMQKRLTSDFDVFLTVAHGGNDLNGFEQYCEKTGRGKPTYDSLCDLLEKAERISALGEEAVDEVTRYINEMEKRWEEE